MRLVQRVSSIFILISVLLMNGCAKEEGSPEREKADEQSCSEIIPVKIRSGGDELQGFYRTGRGEGPRGTAIILSGLPPGREGTFLGLPEKICDSGWNVLYFHYRGSWESGGLFSLSNVAEDVSAVVEFALTEASQQRFGADPERVALMGHSFGGSLAIVAGATNRSVQCVISLSGGNGALIARNPETREMFRSFYASFTAQGGPVKGVESSLFMEELLENADFWDHPNHAEALSEKNVLLIFGTHDEMGPVELHHEPLVRALEEHGADKMTNLVWNTDHNFTNMNDDLSAVIVEWLENQCGN